MRTYNCTSAPKKYPDGVIVQFWGEFYAGASGFVSPKPEIK